MQLVTPQSRRNDSAGTVSHLLVLNSSQVKRVGAWNTVWGDEWVGKGSSFLFCLPLTKTLSPQFSSPPVWSPGSHFELGQETATPLTRLLNPTS